MLSTLNTTKSRGRNETSARMLKEKACLIKHVSSCHSTVQHISISLGEVPEEWKIARVTLIPKSSNRSDPSNYRPISLLSVATQ